MIPTTTRIFVCTQPQDMRRSFDGLALAARLVVGRDPRSGALFVFANRRARHLRILWHSRACSGTPGPVSSTSTRTNASFTIGVDSSARGAERALHRLWTDGADRLWALGRSLRWSVLDRQVKHQGGADPQQAVPVSVRTWSHRGPWLGLRLRAGSLWDRYCPRGPVRHCGGSAASGWPESAPWAITSRLHALPGPWVYLLQFAPVERNWPTTRYLTCEQPARSPGPLASIDDDMMERTHHEEPEGSAVRRHRGSDADGHSRGGRLHPR